MLYYELGTPGGRPGGATHGVNGVIGCLWRTRSRREGEPQLLIVIGRTPSWPVRPPGFRRWLAGPDGGCDGAAAGFLERLGLGGAFLGRDLRCGLAQVTEDFVGRGAVLVVEGQDLVQHVLTIQAAGVIVEPPTADHLKHGPRRPVGHAAADVAAVDALLFPTLELAVVVGVALDQVVGDAYPRRPQAGVAKACQRAVGAIDLVALIARRKQPGAAGDCLGVGVMLIPGTYTELLQIPGTYADSGDISRIVCRFRGHIPNGCELSHVSPESCPGIVPARRGPGDSADVRVGRSGRPSIGEVCRRLKQQGIPSPKGKSYWDRTTVWSQLKNPAYRGAAIFGKTQIGPKRPCLRGQRGRAEHPRRAYSVYDVPPDQGIRIAVPAIVGEELFAAVEERLQENRKRNRQSRRGAKYLLQGLVVCGRCDYAFYGKPSVSSQPKASDATTPTTAASEPMLTGSAANASATTNRSAPICWTRPCGKTCVRSWRIRNVSNASIYVA